MRKIKKRRKPNEELLRLLENATPDNARELLRRGEECVTAGVAIDLAFVATATGRSLLNEDALPSVEKANANNLSGAALVYYYVALMRAYRSRNMLTDAAAAGRNAAENLRALPKHLRPKASVCYNVMAGFASLAFELGNHIDAFEAYREAWQFSAELILEARAQSFSSLLLTAQYLDFSSADLFELHAVYDTIFAGIAPYTHDLAARREEIRAGRKIRVGYISPNFCRHVALHFFYGLLSCRDEKNFETHCYSLTPVRDVYTANIERTVDFFTDVAGLGYADIAAKIYADGIDILADLAGHTADSGLPVLAYKPAPVQVSGIGYLATTGLKAVDYFITDETVDPPGTHEQFFTEKLLYLPSHFCYANGNPLPEPTGAPCRKNGFVTFGVFNQYRKITDEMLGAWLKIMNAAENSRLLLKGKAYNDEKILAAAKERMKNIGFDLAHVTFEPSSQDYMTRYLAIDIALDTYPYTGGGTTCDALYMGVPVVSLYAERRNTRFGLGILSAMGLKYLATKSIDEYAELATALANDFALLDDLHRKIRPMMLASVVGSPEKYTRAMEEKYREILGI